MPIIGGGHVWLLMILLVVVLIIWGPGKLPEMGSGLGRAIREFKRATTETQEHVAAAVTANPDAGPEASTGPGTPAS